MKLWSMPSSGNSYKVRLLLAERAQPRLLYSPYAGYSDLAKGELQILHAAREIRKRYGL